MSKLSRMSRSSSDRRRFSCFCTCRISSSLPPSASSAMACARVTVYSSSSVPGKRTKYVRPSGWRFCHSLAAARAILVLPMPANPHSTCGFRFSSVSWSSRAFTSLSRPFTSPSLSAPAFWARFQAGGIRRRRHSSILRAISSSVMRFAGSSCAASVSSWFTSASSAPSSPEGFASLGSRVRREFFSMNSRLFPSRRLFTAVGSSSA